MSNMQLIVLPLFLSFFKSQQASFLHICSSVKHARFDSSAGANCCIKINYEQKL